MKAYTKQHQAAFAGKYSAVKDSFDASSKSGAKWSMVGDEKLGDLAQCQQDQLLGLYLFFNVVKIQSSL